MDLESWFIDLMENIKKAQADNIGSINYSYSIVLEKTEIDKLVEAYNSTAWIEIY